MGNHDTLFTRFLHPDLGIGGAERLVLDLARAANEKPNHSQSSIITNQYISNSIPNNQKTQIITNHWSPTHCFPETLHKNSPYHPKILFSFIPRSIFNSFFALLAYTKMILASFFLGLFYSNSNVIVIDQVCHCVPFFKFANILRTIFINILTFWRLFTWKVTPRTKILFYCHWPDQLLAKYQLHTGYKLVLYKCYRFLMDLMEKWTISSSDKILVNSKFTANVVAKTLNINQSRLEVLYPTLNIEKFDNYTSKVEISRPPSENLHEKFNQFKLLSPNENSESSILLSINRYEKKKNIKLAIQALGVLPKNKRPILIIAGGYDHREKENIDYKLELEEESKKLGVVKNVMFLTNITDQEKIYLLLIGGY